MDKEKISCKENKKHILIAVDDHESSYNAILYASGFLKNMPEIDITLFHVISLPDEEFFQSAKQRKEWADNEGEKSKKMFSRFRDIMVKEGISSEMIAEKLLMRKNKSVSELIINETQESGYCTVVVGRRHISRKEEFLFGSTSSELLHNLPERICLWIVE